MSKYNRNGFGRLGLILVLPFIILVISYLIYKLFLVADPVVTGIEAFELLSADKTVTIHGENIKTIEITLFQDGQTVELLKDAPENTQKTYVLPVKPKELKLRDGSAVMSIKATAGFLKEISHELQVFIDTVPPVLEIQRAPTVIQQGSAGFAVLRVKNADDVYIKLNDLRFPAFKVATDKKESDKPDQEGSIEQKKNEFEIYRVFFPAPFDIKKGSIFYAMAEDKAGNERVRSLSTRLKMKDFKSSSITIDDVFIQSVVTPLLNVAEISDPVEAFRTVNEQWRKESVEKIIEIAKTTENEVLWKGRFLQMRNSKVMARYGDKRKYVYTGKVVSRSAHLGYDLASYRHAPIQAANSGIVRYASELSIYGNTVIIDHGLGLMSIYGHLSELAVKEGWQVEKGEIIGKTGATGLAGGDHLHFGILVHGYEVSPLYWWDTKWITVHAATDN